MFLLAGAAATLPAGGQPSAAAFHHLHLAAGDGDQVINYYQRLFDPAVVRRLALWDQPALQAGPVVLLVSSPQAEEHVARPSGAVRTAIWHYGWGKVSLELIEMTAR
jgi:hypothetical protein